METKMRKFAVLGASALVLALGLASASAQPNFNGTVNQDQAQAAASGALFAAPALQEGRAAATEGQGIAPVILEKNGVR
jgi:hypothetical protein